LLRIKDLLGGARAGIDLVDTDPPGHALAFLLLTGAEPRVLFVPRARHGPAGGSNAACLPSALDDDCLVTAGDLSFSVLVDYHAA
jgi:hypothetical protein